MAPCPVPFSEAEATRRRRRRRRQRRRSGARPDASADSRPTPACSPPPQPGIENYEIVPNQLYVSNQSTAPYDHDPTQCYHLSGLKDFQIGGYCNFFQSDMAKRATYARSLANLQKFPRFKRFFGLNNTFDMEERKTFISSGCNHSWQEKLYGITRVGVYGVQSVCVVTRNKDLVQLEKDLTRLQGSQFGMLAIPPALINELEDLACPPGERRYATSNSRRNQKPFGVVSVIAGTNEGHKLNRLEADELKAIEFLREEMNSTSPFTFHKVVKTAICALQILWNKKFKADEIQVFVWKKLEKGDDYDDSDYDDHVYGSHHLNTNRDGVVEVLKIRDERSIKDILSVTNNKPRNFADSAML